MMTRDAQAVGGRTEDQPSVGPTGTDHSGVCAGETNTTVAERLQVTKQHGRAMAHALLNKGLMVCWMSRAEYAAPTQ